ncbi:MAG: hypothetical protein IKY94_05410 [Lachnospiraceae bacterium]|nr:hypothetical protein [Lachnospiraceae bacterium]
MTLQEWFDYVKENRYVDIEEAMQENSVIKFYYESLYSSIRKMALESYIYIERYGDKLEYLLERAKIPNSLREYQKQTECDMEELNEICEEAIKSDSKIGKLQLNSSFYNDDIEEITYSADKRELLLALKHSILTDFSVHEEAFDNNDEYINFIISLIEAIYNECDCPIAEEILDKYKNFTKQYYLYNIHEDFKSMLIGSFFKWYFVMRLGSKEIYQNKISFINEIFDDIVEYLKDVNNEIVIYIDKISYRKSKLPLSLEMFKNEIFIYVKVAEQEEKVTAGLDMSAVFSDDIPKREIIFKPQNVLDIINEAIRIAGIQDFIEITEDEEKITYKNKILA